MSEVRALMVVSDGEPVRLGWIKPGIGSLWRVLGGRVSELPGPHGFRGEVIGYAGRYPTSLPPNRIAMRLVFGSVNGNQIYGPALFVGGALDARPPQLSETHVPAAFADHALKVAKRYAAERAVREKRMTECEFCKTDLRGEKIPEELRSPGGPTHYTRTIGIEIPEAYDGVLYWQCPDCPARWHRWPEGHPLHRVAAPWIKR